jgi:hypothetical protein
VWTTTRSDVRWKRSSSAEQELLNLSHDVEAWKRHIAALVEFQVCLERRHSRG